jgi:DNA-3-methyladenine glycosylase
VDVADLSRPAEQVAPDLLGCRVVRAGVTVRLTEVEAYAGESDPASHAFRGRTPRTAVMFGPAGHFYVYFVYGVHWCANLVTGPDGTASAVLLRAGAVEDGLDLAHSRSRGRREAQLARGPAALARVLDLRGDQTGEPAVILPRSGTPLITAGPRVGVRVAADTAWRFHVTDDPSVSAFRAAVSRPRRAGSPP